MFISMFKSTLRYIFFCFFIHISYVSHSLSWCTILQTQCVCRLACVCVYGVFVTFIFVRVVKQPTSTCFIKSAVSHPPSRLVSTPSFILFSHQCFLVPTLVTLTVTYIQLTLECGVGDRCLTPNSAVSIAMSL